MFSFPFATSEDACKVPWPQINAQGDSSCSHCNLGCGPDFTCSVEAKTLSIVQCN